MIILYVTTICTKTDRQLNDLGDLANVISVDDKNILFQCFIRSHFIFSPLCGTVVVRQILTKLKVFRSELFAIFIMTMFLLMPNYGERGNNPLLYVHRIKLILLEVYKIVNIYMKCLLCMIQPMI